MQHHITRLLGKNQRTRNKLANRKTGRAEKHRRYTIKDVRRGLRKMVEGDSSRKASVYTGEQGSLVPFNTLRDLFVACFGFNANSRKKIKPHQQKEMLSELDNFYLPAQGPDAYFWEDEEELIMKTLEFAYNRTMKTTFSCWSQQCYR